MTTNTSQPPQKKAVVSSFIFKSQNEEQQKPLVALFRRSEKVRTYRWVLTPIHTEFRCNNLTTQIQSHHLAPISGSIDTNESPLEAAWRELSEEISLNPTSLAHWRTGKPFSFTDPSVNREWTIHPFAFRLKGPSEGGLGEKAIKTDWEHEGWQWFDPDSVVDNEEFGGVPRLHESLRRVWFESVMNESAGKELAAGIDRLQTDHQSGSQELTSIALTVFRDIVVQTRDGLDDDWWAKIRMAAWHLGKNGRESMGISITNGLISILRDMDEIRQQETNESKWDRVLGVIDLHLDKRKDRAQKIKETFVSYLQSNFPPSNTQQGEKKDRIIMLTVSASSTIRDSILDAFAALENVKTLELRVLESRPLYEGVSIASSLYSQFKSRFPASSLNKNLEIKLYTDASAALAAADVDFLLMGADRISATNGISNKTGSLPAVLSARHAQPSVKVLVLSDLEKVEGLIGEESQSAQEENDPIEVVNGWKKEGVKGVAGLEDCLNASKPKEDGDGCNARVEVKNIYFERIPLTLVDALVCDEGVLKEDNIWEKSRQLGEEMERYFGDI